MRMPYDYSGSLSWVRGRHEFKFGGGYQRLQVNVLQGIATNGFFVFAPFPMYPMRSPVSCLASRYSFCRAGVILNAVSRGNALNGYVQDTYKATSRLTLNLGLRYDLPFPYTEIKNRQTLWVPGRQSTVMPDAPPGLALSRRQGCARRLDPDVQEGIRAAGRLRLGPDGKRQVAGHICLRNFL